MSYKVTGSSEKGKFINAVKGLSHPEKVSRALKTICDITAKTQVITQLNECETVAPLVEIALNYKDGPEREDAFAALLNIFKSSGKPPASATWDNPAKSFADRLVDMSLSYMGSSDDNSETQGIGLVVLGNAARLCSNPKIIKDSPFVEVEGKNIKLIPNALFLMGSLIERYYTDCDALKKSEKELEKSKLRDLYTKPSSLSSSSSSSSPPPSPQSLPRTQHQTASTVVKTTACASTSSSGTSQQQAQEYPKIEDYFDEEKVKSIANRHKYSLDLHEKHTPQQDPHNKYVIYFYERVTIHAIKQNVSGLEEVIKKTLEASFSAITEKDSFGFTLKFLIEYITFSNTEDTDMLNKCIRTIEKGFKSIRNYKELDKFLNIYSEHFYHKNLKRLDKSVVLITRTMMSNCSEESLQAFALKALASVPISIINAPIVGTRETVSYVTSTLKNYRQNKDILLNGLKLLCNLIDFGNKEVNEEVAKEVNNSLYMRETFRALLSALTSKDMMLKVIGYKAFIQALDVKDKKVRLVDSCLRSDDVINKLLADVKADGQINKSRNLQEGALEMLLKLNLDKRVDAKFFEDDTIYAKGTTCCLLFRIAERLETLSKGAFDKVLSALEKHIADWEVQRLGCLIIGNNVTKDNIDRGLEVVIRAVETYNVQNVLSAGYKAILTIWNKLESEHERIYEQIGGELFFKTSSETDWRHPNIDKINSMTAANYFELVFALLDVFSLSKLDSNSTEILMIEVRAMERHRTDERVQLACCKIIKHFLGSNAFYAIKDTLEQVLEELTGINRGNRTLVDLYGDLRKGDDSRPGKKDPGKRINSRKSIVIAKSMNQINIDAELPESTGILSLFAMGPMEMQKTLEESLREAEFKEIQSLLKYSREVAEYLRDEGVLDKYKMTLSESMAITIYTYDNGPDMLEYNPYRIINKALATADKDAIRKLRLYIFYLLKALRKLKKTEAQKLYRTIRGSRDQTYNVGKELIWPAFTSTTTDKAVAEDFINNFNEETDIVLFEINGQGLNGYNIREFSFHPDEDEVLLEIGTRVRVSDKHAEIKSSKAKCVALEVISTELSLVDEVKRFSEFCKDQEDDQAKDTAVDTVLPQEIKVINPVPAEEYDEAKVRDNKLSTEAKYQGLKVCLRCTDTKILGPMLKALKKLVDDQYCDGVNMIKMYQLTQEDFGAIFASTFCYEDPKCSRKCVADALNEALLEQSKIKDCWYLYLMHLINGLRKLPTCTDSSTTYYACVPKDWSPSCGKEYVMPGFSIGYTDREEALKMAHSSGGVNYNVIEFPGKGVKAYNIAPLSAGLRDCTVIIEPFFHFKVVSLSNEDTTCVEQSQENSLLEEALLKCLTRFKGEAPLPKGWEIQVDEATGKEYYVNTETDQTQWNKPEIISPHFYSPNVDEWKKSHKPSGSRDILRIGTRVGATSALAASMDSSSAEVPFGTCLTRSMPEIPIEDDSEIPLGGSSETPIESNSEIPLGGDPKDSETSLEDNPEIPLGTVGVPAKVPKAVPPPTMPTTSTFQTNAVAPPRYENRNRLSTAVSLSTTKKQDTRQNRKTKNIYGLSQSHQPQTSKTMPLPQGQCWQASTYAPTQNQYKQQSFSQISQYPPQYQQCNNSFQSQPKWNYQPQFNQKTQLLGMNWVTMQDSMTGRFYYANTVTKETSWTMPQRWN